MADLQQLIKNIVSTHSRPKAAASQTFKNVATQWFQHTAARRRLPLSMVCSLEKESFNTQPPEGGCLLRNHPKVFAIMFQHTAARRRLPLGAVFNIVLNAVVSTHSRPKAAAAI